jgi:hypothetical protein
MPEQETIKRSSDFHRLDELENKIVQIQVDALNSKAEDHEKRIRSLEDTATKFNFILYLTMGGGFVSLVNLAMLFQMFMVANQK